MKKNVKGRWVIGWHSVKEAIKVRPHDVVEVWLSNERHEASEVKVIKEELSRWKNIQVSIKSAQYMSQMGKGHQGVACRVLSSPELNWKKIKNKEHVILLILDRIEDPQNLGSLVRTSWLMGVEGIIVPQNRAVGITPAVSKVASGGLEHLPIEICPNVPVLLRDLKEMGFWIYGMDHQGAVPLWDTVFAEKIALIIGGESHGMRTSVRSEVDQIIKIPQLESSHSYNAAVSGAIVLAEVKRQFFLNLSK